MMDPNFLLEVGGVKIVNICEVMDELAVFSLPYGCKVQSELLQTWLNVNGFTHIAFDHSEVYRFRTLVLEAAERDHCRGVVYEDLS